MAVTTPLISRPYVEITTRLMRRFGVEVGTPDASTFVVPAGARYASPGTIVVEILAPLPPGMARGDFKRELQGRLQAASLRLIEEAGRSDNAPPVPLSAAIDGETGKRS